MGDQGQFSSLLTKIIPKHGPPRKEGKRKIGQLKEGTKENDKGAQEHSRLITQNGSKVNTIDVTRSRHKEDLTACSGMYKLASVPPRDPKDWRLQVPYSWTTAYE